jgi:hypothetical protein
MAERLRPVEIKFVLTSSHLGAPQRPEGAGYMPYSEAAYWLATEGGTIDIPEIERASAWESAYRVLNDHISTGEIHIIGRRHGQGTPTQIKGHRFSGIAIEYPFANGPLMRGDEPCIMCRLPRDEEHWRREFNDRLMANWRSPVAEFTHLEVRKSDIARLWPFPSPEPSREGDPPSRTRFFNQRNAAQFAEEYVAQAKEAGHGPTLEGCRRAAQQAGYKGGRRLLDQAYREQMAKAGYNVGPGRRRKNPPKKPAEK